MAVRHFALALLAAGIPASTLAGVTVIGAGDARLCYEAADSPTPPRRIDMQRCDNALLRDNLSRYDTVATHVNRGILRVRTGQIDAAIDDFDDAIRIDPNQPEAYLNKGAALMRRDEADADAALGLFTIALERNTRRPAIAHYGRAVAHEALGNVAAAYRDYRRASEIEPDWAEPRAELQRFRVVPR
jgi:tetratricopeptide (TPR) repeat protein